MSNKFTTQGLKKLAEVENKTLITDSLSATL